MSDVDIHHEIRKKAYELKKVVELLEPNGNQNSNLATVKDSHGNLPIHTAMSVGKIGVFDLVQVLVKMNPEGIRTKTKDGNLPIHLLGPELAFNYGDMNKVRKLLLKEYPEGSKVQNKKGELPIHCLADRGCSCWYSKTSELLLELYPEGIKVKEKNGHTPLHVAVMKGNYEVAVLICKKYPNAAEELDRRGRSPIDIVVEERDTIMCRLLARSCPDAFNIERTARRIRIFLENSKFPRREMASFLLQMLQNSMGRYSRMGRSGTRHIAELKSKLESMASGKENILNEEEPRVQDLMEENKTIKDQLEQEQQQAASFREQIENAKQEQQAQNKRNEKRVAELIEDNNKCEAHLKKSQDNLEQKKQVVASLKEQNQEKLEQEKQRFSILKEQVEHAEKRIQSFELTRKSESKLLSKLLETNDDWTIQDLKSIAKSLNTRLDLIRTQVQAGSQPSMAQTFLPYLLEKADPSKEHLLQTIKAIDSELSELEITVASLSTFQDTAIPAATRSLDESPENVPRKRARVSISAA